MTTPINLSIALQVGDVGAAAMHNPRTRPVSAVAIRASCTPEAKDISDEGFRGLAATTAIARSMSAACALANVAVGDSRTTPAFAPLAIEASSPGSGGRGSGTSPAQLIKQS